MTEAKNVNVSYILTWGRDVIAKRLNGSEEIAGRWQNNGLHVKHICVLGVLLSWKTFLARENLRFSSLLVARDVSRGGTSATQGQKFHIDDANQCSNNKSGSHGVPNLNLSNFTCLQVDFGKVLCSSANEHQQNSNASSRGDYIPQILTVLLEILRVYIWPLWPFVFRLSFVNNG